MSLSGEGQFNLNILKEISVTDDFLSLDEEIRGCQNRESFDECTSRKYLNEMSQKCGCLSLSHRLSDKDKVCVTEEELVCIANISMDLAKNYSDCKRSHILP